MNPFFKIFLNYSKYKIQRSAPVKGTSPRRAYIRVIAVQIVLEHLVLRPIRHVVANEVVYLQSVV